MIATEVHTNIGIDIPHGWHFATYEVMYADASWEEAHRLDYRRQDDYIFGLRVLELLESEVSAQKIRIKLYANVQHAIYGSPYADEHLWRTYEVTVEEAVEHARAQVHKMPDSMFYVKYAGHGKYRMYHATPLKPDVDIFFGKISACVQTSWPVRGYCTTCNQLRPMDMVKMSGCGACARTGHNYRIVSSEADRLWRIEHWTKWWEEQGLTLAEIEKRRGIQSLNNPPDGWDEKIFSYG